jgi:hypothetical protein
MARLTYDELEKVKKKYNTDRLWSWSKMNTYTTSKFEYLLKYILKSKEDRCDSCYTTLGTICHDTLEKFYEGKIEYKDMIEDYNDGFTTAIVIAELKFNRSDEEKNKSIGEKYNENLIHFFKNHIPYKYKLLVEKPIVVNIVDENADKDENNVFVGYIDALYKDDDDNYHILDFKSSSIYTGKTLEENSGQLILYSIGLHQMGIPYDKIKPQFNFLKYCTIKYEQKNGAIKYRNVERCKIGESLQSNAKSWLKHFGYEADADEYLMKLLDTNSIDCMPEKVKEKYEITDCHVDVELNDKIVLKWSNHVVMTLNDIKLREDDYEETKSMQCFWDDEEDVKAQSYYFANLCSYSATKHLPYKAYLEKFEAAQKGEDMFSGLLGSNSSASSSKVIEVDTSLDWLNNI